MNASSKIHISAGQMRAARGLLNWSQEEVAQASALSIATIRKLEAGHISPRKATTQLIRQVFEDAGLEFIEPNGVRHRPEEITIYQGSEGAKAFFDDVYETSKKLGGDVVQVWPSADPIIEVLGSYDVIHFERMTSIMDRAHVKCILTDSNSVRPASYCEYRSLSKYYVDSVPFYVYGDKYALIFFDADPFPKIIVIESRTAAQAFRRQFFSMWEKATPFNDVEKSTGNLKKSNAKR